MPQYYLCLAKVPPKNRPLATPLVEHELQLKSAELDGEEAFEDIISGTLTPLDLRSDHGRLQ